MTLEVLADPQATAERAAAIIAADARAAAGARGKFSMAVSGGHTPWVMLRALANQDVPWATVQVFQVDERVAPDGHRRSSPHLQCPSMGGRGIAWYRMGVNSFSK